MFDNLYSMSFDTATGNNYERNSQTNNYEEVCPQFSLLQLRLFRIATRPLSMHPFDTNVGFIFHYLKIFHLFENYKYFNYSKMEIIIRY
jgi:hypothetical protein